MLSEILGIACRRAGTRPISRWLLVLLFTSIIASCAITVPYMQLDQGLAAVADAMPVQGREGWLINQQLAFGSFITSPVKRGWTKGYNIPFIVRFSGAKEKLGFSVRNRSGEEAELFCLGQLREIDLPVLNRAFEVNLKTTDVFTCAISMADQSFEFYSENLNQNPRFDAPAGQLKGPGVEVSIRPVTSLENGQSSWSTSALGYELFQDNQAVAAVETLNDGRVWINPALIEQQQLLAAGVAAALLLRNSLADHNDDLL